MPIPFLFGAAAAGVAIVGAVQAFSGIDKFNQAKKIGESAQQKYESAIQELELEREKLKTIAQDYVRLQMDVNRVTIRRFLAFIQQITCSS
ncbi:MAG: hypothetical protein ACKO5Q_02830, partial [Microcystaceae cyanobacterium]